MESTVIPAVVLALVALVAWRTVLWRPRDLPGVRPVRPLLLGHRGVRPVAGQDSATIPRENTLRAFLAALEAGLDGVECDVQLSSDGRLVLFHDRNLGDAVVTATPFEELKRLDPQLTTLEELLELAAQYPGTLINIELKLYRRVGRGLERKVARAVKAAGLADRVIISSFDPLALARMRFASYGLRTALLTTDKDVPRWLRGGGSAGWLHVDALHPRRTQAAPALFRRAASRNLPLNFWTVNDTGELLDLVERGANGIIGDDPALMLAATGRSGGAGEEQQVGQRG